MRQRSFYFSDGQYLQLLQSLCHDLTKAEAFVQLMGSAKSGKSALCETLTLYLRRKGHDVVYIDYPIESPEMLHRVLAQKFSLPNVNNVAKQLQDALLTNFEKPKLLIFDDAHQLSDITLLEIYRMAEIQASSKRVLNVLLCGEQELDTRLLNKKELSSLLRNVSLKYLLKPMDKETLSRFFLSYVAQKGLPGLQLSKDALGLLYRSSKGYPGPATLLVELAVQSAAGNSNQNVITKLELAEQINDSDIQQGLTSAESFSVGQLNVLGPIAAVFTIAAMGFMFSIINSEDNDVPLDQASLVSTNSDSPFSARSGSISTSTSQIETNDVIEAGSGVVSLSTEQTASNPILEPALAQSIPSTLRPASIFSIDDEERVSDSDLAFDAPVLAGEDVSVNSRVAIDDVIETGAVKLVEEKSEERREAQTREQAEQLIQAAPVTSDTTQPDQVGSADATVRARVDSWVSAWQQQSLEGYFASYSPEFEPRDNDSVARWRASRTRVIGNAQWIRLTLSDYEIIKESANSIEIHFWLDYESPTYSDSTKKKLVLGNDSGNWMILEEINLQVRA
ncbi:MAG: type II secretory pathway predicted ATPase ExeA [Pseudohongiellaceae bacterium]|jgi:type II secretory pathway predicted ATPase ExeA